MTKSNIYKNDLIIVAKTREEGCIHIQKGDIIVFNVEQRFRTSQFKQLDYVVHEVQINNTQDKIITTNKGF